MGAPGDALLTARDLIPAEVSLEDAVFNASRCSLFVAGLVAGDADLVQAGLADRLHEPYRGEVVEDLDAVKSALLTAGTDGAVMSGAGPTVVGILLDTDDSIAFRRAVKTAEKATRLLADIPGRQLPVALPVDRRGAAVL